MSKFVNVEERKLLEILNALDRKEGRTPYLIYSKLSDKFWTRYYVSQYLFHCIEKGFATKKWELYSGGYNNEVKNSYYLTLKGQIFRDSLKDGLDDLDAKLKQAQEAYELRPIAKE